MIVHVSLGPDGQIYVNEGTTDEGKLICEVSSIIIAGLGLFDESRLNFSWNTDAERAAHLVEWQLEDAGYEIFCTSGEYLRLMAELCSPGGPTGGAFDLSIRRNPDLFVTVTGKIVGFLAEDTMVVQVNKLDQVSIAGFGGDSSVLLPMCVLRWMGNDYTIVSSSSPDEPVVGDVVTFETSEEEQHRYVRILAHVLK